MTAALRRAIKHAIAAGRGDVSYSRVCRAVASARDEDRFRSAVLAACSANERALVEHVARTGQPILRMLCELAARYEGELLGQGGAANDHARVYELTLRVTIPAQTSALARTYLLEDIERTEHIGEYTITAMQQRQERASSATSRPPRRKEATRRKRPS